MHIFHFSNLSNIDKFKQSHFIVESLVEECANRVRTVFVRNSSRLLFYGKELIQPCTYTYIHNFPLLFNLCLFSFFVSACTFIFVYTFTIHKCTHTYNTYTEIHTRAYIQSRELLCIKRDLINVNFVHLWLSQLCAIIVCVKCPYKINNIYVVINLLIQNLVDTFVNTNLQKRSITLAMPPRVQALMQ